MADEAEGAQAAEQEASEGEGTEEGKKRKLLPLILVAVLVLVGTGAGAYWFGLIPGLGGEPEEELGEGVAEGDGAGRDLSLGPTMSMDPFIVNLADPDGKRYLKANIEVEFYGDKVPEAAHAMMPQIRDSLLTLLTSKAFKEIRTPEGKQGLREEIIARLNQSLQADSVKGVYFTEFIIQ